MTEAPTAQALPAVLAETHDMLAREKLLTSLLDRCAREVAILESLYIKGARHRFLVDFESCVRRLGAAGHVRNDLEIAAARASLEMPVWMAMRRRGDPEPPPAMRKPRETSVLRC